jgi:hypothetical protein
LRAARSYAHGRATIGAAALRQKHRRGPDWAALSPRTRTGSAPSFPDSRQAAIAWRQREQRARHAGRSVLAGESSGAPALGLRRSSDGSERSHHRPLPWRCIGTAYSDDSARQSRSERLREPRGTRVRGISGTRECAVGGSRYGTEMACAGGIAQVRNLIIARELFGPEARCARRPRPRASPDAARGARRALPPGVGTAVLKRSSSSGTDGRNVRPRRAGLGIASACLGSEGLGVGGGQALARGRVAARRQ